MNTKQMTSISQAIVELGLAQLQAAAAYCRTAMAMLSTGIPRAEAARLLELTEAETIETQALTYVRKWAASPEGLLVVCGPYGCGKSMAGQLVALERYRAGLRTRWLPLAAWPAHDLDAQGRWVADADAAPLLVLDDLGAGLTNPKADGGGYGGHLRDVAEGVILRAIADGRGVLLISNGSEASLVAWLGGRLEDRLRTAGGFKEIPEDTPSQRKRGRVELDGAGRWPAWARAAELLDFFGCAGEDYGRRFLLEAQRLGASRDPDDRKRLTGLCRRGASMLGLDRGPVIAQAKLIDERTAEMLTDAKRVLGVDVAEPTFEAIADALARKTGMRHAEQAAELRGYTGPRDYAPPPDLPPLDSDRAREARAVMMPMGYRVKPSSMGGFRLFFRENELSYGWPSEGQAWISAHDEHRGAGAA